MCSLYNLCRIALLGCVLGLVFSGLHVRLCTVLSYYCVERRRSKAGSCIIVSLVSVACQDDWIASRMKNSAKLAIFYSFQQFSVGGLSSQYLFDECIDSMQEAISGATGTIIYGLRMDDFS